MAARHEVVGEDGGRAMGVQFAVWGEKGVRKEMEDEHLAVPSLTAADFQLPADVLDISLFGIFDGHGGRQSAVFAKANFASELATHIGGSRQEPDKDGEVGIKDDDASEDAIMADAIRAEHDGRNESRGGGARLTSLSDYRMRKSVSLAFQKLDSRIATEIPACKDGSTAVVVLLQGRQVTIATLGDAAAFLGIAAPQQAPTISAATTMPSSTTAAAVQAVPLSEVHKPWDIKEKERILKAGGTVENGRVNGILEVSRSLGDLPQKRYGVSCTPSLKKFRYTAGRDKFVLIGCDGFWSAWSAEEAVSFAWSQMAAEELRVTVEGADPPYFDLRRVCRELVEHVIVQKKSQDNVSLIILKFDDDDDSVDC